MMDSEFSRNYNNKVIIRYESIGEGKSISIKGVLKSDTENFVYLVDSIAIVETRGVQIPSKVYINKSKILELIVDDINED